MRSMHHTVMRSVLAGLAVMVVARGAAAEVEPISKWVRYENKKLGVAVSHPAAAKVEVVAFGLRITGADIATVEIAVSDTKDRNTSKSGGKSQDHIEWTIAVPKRSAKCHAETTDDDKAVIASSMCDTIELTPGPRDPHVEIAVTSSGLADSAAYEKAVLGKQHAIDACWKAALAKDATLPEGSLTVKRAFDDGKPTSTNEHADNFFDHDTKGLATCVFGALEGVAVKTADKDASIKLDAVCRFY
jgi:hypothetical protein